MKGENFIPNVAVEKNFPKNEIPDNIIFLIIKHYMKQTPWGDVGTKVDRLADETMAEGTT